MQTNQMNGLDGQIAIVTGGTQGLGAAIATTFAQRRAKGLVICGRNAAKGAAQATKIQQETGVPVHFVAADLSQVEDCRRVVAEADERFGRIDILVNAAAVGIFGWIEDLSYLDWRRTMVGELDIVFLACKAAWPHLIRRGGGSIINFASANARQALAVSGALAHCAGKGGVLAMTRQLAMEGGPHGIRANTISPALIVTAATAAVVENPDFETEVMRKLMIKRLGQPEDAGWLASFLASDESSWITGADYALDGGATAW